MQLHAQFALSRNNSVLMPGFVVQELAAWKLSAHHALPTHRLLGGGDKQFGWILGWPIRDGRLHLDPTDFHIDGDIESLVAQLSGRFVVFDGSAVYPDHFASLGVVYCSEQQVLASTTYVLSVALDTTFDIGLNEFPDDTLNQFYPSGLTHSPDFKRLLPNHCLDMSSWEVRRFWPKESVSPCGDADTPRLVEEAVAAIRSTLTACRIDSSPIYSALTAGRDSRVLLACTPDDVRLQTEYFTFRYPDGKYFDDHIGNRLAHLLRLKHRVIPVDESTDDQRVEYLKRIGRAGGSGKSRDFWIAAQRHFDMSGVWLTGFGGEVAVMYFCRDGDDKRPPSAHELLKRLHLPEHSEFVEATEQWISRLPGGCSGVMRVELFYLEMRVGAWASPHLYGAAPFRVSIIPFANRRYIEACFRMPYAFRRSRESQIRILGAADPRTLSLPFESITGLSWVWHKLRKNRFYDLTRR